MQEACIALVLVGLGIASTRIQPHHHATALLLGGLACTTLGFVASLITGFFYHLLLWRALAPLNLLPPKWYWAPTKLHIRVPRAKKHDVLIWFYLGATSFGLVMVGAAFLLLGLYAA